MRLNRLDLNASGTDEVCLDGDGDGDWEDALCILDLLECGKSLWLRGHGSDAVMCERRLKD